MRFIKIFWGQTFAVEDDINEMAENENLNIVSASTCIDKGTLFVTVVFEKQDMEE